MAGTGTGSPISFICARCRRTTVEHFGVRKGVRVTGRTKPYKPKKYSAPGTRSTFVSREYECLECGHVGWSNHIGLEKIARWQSL